MEVISTNKERIYTLQFRGELDHHNAKEAIRKMELKLGAALPKQLLLDFAGVTFMDSSGIALAVRAQRQMTALGGNAALCNVPPQARKVFDAAGITRMVPILEEEKGK
ncbi:MAG: STAS domain-containing protein [Oscillospiraceae bacterium]|nr:STAS domain-containing protein [Oscillospiraceae bacterium]